MSAGADQELPTIFLCVRFSVPTGLFEAVAETDKVTERGVMRLGKTFGSIRQGEKVQETIFAIERWGCRIDGPTVICRRRG